MKKSNLLFLCYWLILIVSGCNESSYIEDIGPAPSSGSATGGAKMGRIVFYCTNYKLATNCGRLDVYVDSEYKGQIEEMSGSAPTCGAKGKNALTLVLPVGSHSFSISSSVSNCLRYNFSTTIEDGYCISYELQ